MPDDKTFDPTDFNTPLIDTSKEGPPEVEGQGEAEVEEELPEKTPVKTKGDEEQVEEVEPTEPPEPEKEPKPPENPEDMKCKVKVYGKEAEVSVKELIRGYQKAEASDRRFQEAAQRQREADAWFEELRANPWRAFELAGMDPFDAAQQVVWNMYREAKMTPQQRAAWQAQQRLEAAERRLQAVEQERYQHQAQQTAMQYTEYYTPVLVEAIEKYSVPDTPYGRDKLIEAMFSDLNDGIEPDAAALAERVRDDIARELGVLKGLSPQKLSELLGEDMVRQIVRARAAPAGRVRPSGPKVGSAPAQVRERRTYVTPDEFSEALSKFTERG